ncbi:STM2901 family protein [Paraburkholderia tropica]|uniref:STM2901 family protein n=1 Tax=Paraburkholderia tropica TaxID=92647 RepID=UPI0007ED781C|nr:hypothetical protein [Paraburkholderia tropica]OBR53968.1 hypothetical protein A6456_21785 [Paraburkholderia tropica]
MSGNVYDYGIHRNLSPSELFFLVFLDETSQQLGMDDLVDVAAIIVGWPLLPTRRKPGGTTKGTSIASRVARRHLDFEIKARILPTLTLKSASKLKILFTNNLGVFVGRAVPVVGEVMLTYDAATISYKSVIHYNRLVKPEDKVF